MEKIIDVRTSNNKKMLVDEIHDVCRQIASTNKWFQMEDDSDLIEACIYQMEVLKARHRYLLRKARAENISCSPICQKGDF